MIIVIRITVTYLLMFYRTNLRLMYNIINSKCIAVMREMLPISHTNRLFNNKFYMDACTCVSSE